MVAWYEWRRREVLREEEEGLRSPRQAENWIFKAFAGLVGGSKHRNRIQRVGICRFPRSNRSIREGGVSLDPSLKSGRGQFFFSRSIFSCGFGLRTGADGHRKIGQFSPPRRRRKIWQGA